MDEFNMDFPFRYEIQRDGVSIGKVRGKPSTDGRLINVDDRDGIAPLDVAVDMQTGERYSVSEIRPAVVNDRTAWYVLTVRRLPSKQLMSLSVGPVTISAVGGSTNIFNSGSIGDVTTAPHVGASLVDLLKLAGEIPAEHQELFMELVDQLRAIDKGAEIKPKGFLNRFAPIFETSANAFAAVLSIIASIMTMTS